MKGTKRFLSWLLIVCTVFGMLPAVALTASAASTYTKVTTAPTDWSGTYLIVSEESNVALNGSLTALDANNNNLAVTIADGTIAGSTELDAATVTIAAVEGGYTVKTASGYYIGCTTDANRINSTTEEADAYLNTLSMNDDATVNILASGGAYLRFNSTSTAMRFRYYKSTTYTAQEAITLYKLSESTDSGSEGGEGGSTPEDTTGPQSGKYVIAANVNGTYYAMSNTFPTSGGQINGSTIKVTDGMVAVADAANYVITLTKTSGGYTIENATGYLKYDASNRVVASEEAYAWSFGTGTRGTYRVIAPETASTTAVRALSFSTSSTKFAANAAGTVDASSSYYDLELLPLDGVSVASGQYVIAANVNGTYYAMSNTFATHIPATPITVTNGKVAGSDAADYVITLTETANGYTIYNGRFYLDYMSATQFTVKNDAAYWTISKGSNGSYRIVSQTNTGRGLIYQVDGVQFGAYALSNAYAGSSDYYDVEILPIDGEIPVIPDAPTTDIATGNYVIAANIDGTYYAMSNTFPSAAGRINGSPITVVDGKVPGAEATDYVVTVTRTSTGYTIENATGYLKYYGSSTNLIETAEDYNWTIELGTNGSYRVIVPETEIEGVTTRGLIYNAVSAAFGAYSTSLVSATSTSYYDIELLPIAGEISGGVEIEDGYYVIAANVDGTYYGLSSAFANGAKVPGSVVNVTDGTVTASDAKGYVVYIKKTSDGYTIYNGTNFLVYGENHSGTNLHTSSEEIAWIVSEGENGAYHVVSSENTSRGVLYRTGDYNTFGGYSSDNVLQDEYFDVFFLPITGDVVFDDNSSGEGGDTGDTTGSSYVTMKIITGEGEAYLLHNGTQYGLAATVKGTSVQNKINSDETLTIVIKPASGYRIACVERTVDRLVIGNGTDEGTDPGYKYDATLGAYVYTFKVAADGGDNYFRLSFLPRQSVGAYTAKQITAWNRSGDMSGLYVITGLEAPETYENNLHSTATTYLLYGDDDIAVDESYEAIGRKSSALQLSYIGVALNPNEPYLMSNLSEPHIMEFKKDTSGYYSIRLYGASGANYYICARTSGAKIYTSTQIADSYGLWDITYLANGAVKIENVGWKEAAAADATGETLSRYLMFNNESTNLQFRCYPEDETQASFPVLYAATQESYYVTYSVTGNGGSVSAYNETSSLTIASASYQPTGSTIKFTFKPASGYVVDTVTVNGTAVTLTDNTYTCTNLSQDITVVATFKEIGSVNFTVTYYINNTIAVTASINAKTPYTLQTTGTVTGTDGKTYDLSKLTVGGAEYSLSNLSYDGSTNGSVIKTDLNALIDVNTGDKIEARFSTTRVDRTKTVKEVTDMTATDAANGGENIEDSDNWFSDTNGQDKHGNVQQTYEVTLNVKSNDKIDEVEKGGETDIILVLDHSNSMYPPYTDNDDYIREAVDKFTDIVFANNNEGNNRVAVVQYDTYARAWNNAGKANADIDSDTRVVKYSGTMSNSSYSTLTYANCFMNNKANVMTAVDTLMWTPEYNSAGGLTNTMGGLKMAEIVANTRATATAIGKTATTRNMVVIMFTDGLPTCRYYTNSTEVTRDGTYYPPPDDYETGGTWTSAWEYTRALEAGQSLRTCLNKFTKCESTIYNVALLNDADLTDEDELIADYFMNASSNYVWTYDTTVNSSKYQDLKNYVNTPGTYFRTRTTAWADNYTKLTGNIDADTLASLYEEIAYTYIPAKYVTGTITDIIPADFKLTAESKAALIARGCTVTENADGTTTIKTPSVTADETGATFVYNIVYQGSGYGGLHTNEKAMFEYVNLQTDETVTSYFPMPTATVIPWTVNDRAITEPGITTTINILGNDLFEELTQGGYVLSDFTITLTDENGNPTTYEDAVEQLGLGFDAVVDPASNTVTFYTEKGGVNVFYYVVSAKATAPDGTETVVYSRATQVIVLASELEKTAQEVTDRTDLPAGVEKTTDAYGNTYQIYKITLAVTMFNIKDGNLTDKIPDYFEFIQFAEGNTMGTASFDDTTNTITCSGIVIGDTVEEHHLSYYVRYVGENGTVGTGVVPTNSYATFSYTQISDDGQTETEEEKEFPVPTAGVNPFTTNDIDISKTGEENTLPIGDNDMYTEIGTMVDDYLVTDVNIYLTDENGTPLTEEQIEELGIELTINEDGSISYTAHEEGVTQFYYVVESKVTVPGNNTYAEDNDTTLVSRPTLVTIYTAKDTLIVVDFGLTTDAVDFIDFSGITIDKDILLENYVSAAALGTSAYGDLDQSNKQLSFTPTTMDFDAVAEYSTTLIMEACAYNNNTAKELPVEFKVIPANNIYYEFENPFIDFKNADDTASKWEPVGTATSGMSQSAGDEHNVKLHGYDATYSASSQYSGGRQMGVTVTKADYEENAYFTFSGTGFDVIGTTNKNSGILIAEIYNYDASKADGCGTKVKNIIVDTYLAGDASYEQIPVISYRELKYGTYRVKLRAFYNEIFDKNYGTTTTTESVSEKATRAATVTDAKIREILGWDAGEQFEMQTVNTENAVAAKNTKALADAVNGQYNVYVDAVRIYNPIKTSEDEEEVVVDPLPSTLDDLVSGKYVIAAYANGTYYAMSNTFPTAATIGSTVITLENNKISAANATDYMITLTKTESGYTIYNGTKYLSYGTSGTQLRSSDEPYYWNPSVSTQGVGFRVNASVELRALSFQAGTINKFGGYHTSNIKDENTSYFDIVFIPVDETVAAPVEIPDEVQLYTAAGEIDPNFININDKLISAKNFDGDFESANGESVNGALYIADGGDTANEGAQQGSTGCYLSASGKLTTQTVDGKTYLLNADGERYTVTIKAEDDTETACDVYRKEVTVTDPTKPNHVYDYYYTYAGAEYQLTQKQLNKLGLVYYDDKYESVGPENEVYLTNGSGIAFTVNKLESLQVSMKVPYGDGTVELEYYNSINEEWDTVATITSRTEMYYAIDVATLADNLLVLRAKISDENTVLSLCSAKIAGSATTTTGVLTPMNYAQVSKAIRLIGNRYDVNIFDTESETDTQEAIVDENLDFTMSLMAGAEMQVAYTIVANAVAGYESFYLEVEKDYADQEAITYTYDVDGYDQYLETKEHPTTGEALMYLATFAGINAKEMGDSFRTTLYAVAADGTLYRGETKEASMKDYLVSKIDASTSSNELKTMAADMLAYGAAAQTYMGYNAENLVTADLTEAQLAYATKEIPTAVNGYTESGEGASITASVTVESRVNLYLNSVYTPAEGADVKFVLTDPESGSLICHLLTNVKDGVMCQASYADVGAKEMRKPISITLYDGETAVSKTITWSVESYVAQVREDAYSSAEKIAMVNAMLAYGDSVAAYMTSIGQ